MSKETRARESVDRAERYAKSPHCTIEEHDAIMVAVRLARNAAVLADEARLAERKLQGWQDIATAPRDGSEIDLWWPGQIGRSAMREANVYWNKHDGFWRRRDRSHCIYGMAPSHWRPLPEPPATAIRKPHP